MYKSRGSLLITVLLVVAGVDATWMCLAQGSGAATRNAFQKATGGVGLGAAVSPGWSFFTFDPRTEAGCENELWPIPGITCYSPHHGATVADLPPMYTVRNVEARAVEGGDP